jgi:alpha-galactosidase
LLDGGQPATGSYDLQFRLTDALSGGNPIGAALTNAPVLVTNGLFLVLLDFGSGAFDGSPRWLEVGVRTNGSAGPYVVLSPRQAITASPYATFASTAANASVAAGLVPGVTIAANGAGITNLSAGQLVGTVTVPVASDLSASSNYNANRLVGTIPLANLPSQVLSNTGLTSGIPVSAIQPLESFSLASIAPTPPMGICTWPLYNGGNQGLVQMFTDMLSTNGLVGYGWKVIQLDAGWQLPSRDSNENLVPDPARYTNWTGMLSYMQTSGVALGLYTEMTSCGGNVPTLDGYYAQDAAQFASWGVSYLKVDCGDLGDQRYVQFSDFRAAMEQAGLSAYVINGGLNPPAGFPVRAWLPAVVNAWRLGMDGDSYLFGGEAVAQGNMLLHFHHALEYGAAFTGPGHYPDMDFINTGQADYGDYVNTSTSPYRYPTIESDIGLAAMCPSPIMVDTVNLALMPIYTNTAFIAIDQDPLVMPAQVVSSNATSEVWSRRLFNGDRAVALINKTGSSQAISVNLSALGLPAGPTAVYSVWDQAYLPCAPAAFTSSVDPWYVQLLRFSPTQAGLFTGTVGLTSNSVPYTLHITNGLIYGVSSP